jgi:redox-sensitive bicupin YhaK (pirin superfamily)
MDNGSMTAESSSGSGSRGPIELLIESQTKDLGEFEVRRTLPSKDRQRVGPFIFFDHMGPARFAPGAGVAVRPHPHIGLSTLTYLYDGTILHRDSLGSVQPITPGAVNWMTAGRGIVHSERTPPDLLASGSTIHGLQIWLALPLELEETEPGFAHYPAESIPIVEQPGVRAQIVAGEAYGARSPVVTTSDTLYISLELAAGATVAVPDTAEERAVYVVAGEIRIDDRTIGIGTMAVLTPGAQVTITATSAATVVVLGGAPLSGRRYLYWNLVSSSRERIEQAKEDWRNGRFAKVPGDDEFIPLPD